MARFDGLTIWTDAFIADTLDLDAEEIGVYFLLLMAAWRSPTCDLPDDDKSLARFARCSPRRWVSYMRVKMLLFWRVVEGRWVQKRLSLEREAVENRSKKAGQAAHERWRQNSDKPGSSAIDGASNHLMNNTGADATASSEHMLSACLDDASHARVNLDLDKDKKERKDISFASLTRRSRKKLEEPPEGFSEWWAAYPRKEAKPRATKAYASALRSGATPEVLLAALRRFRWNRDREFIPYPASWLNDRRWLDEQAPQAGQPSELRGGL